MNLEWCAEHGVMKGHARSLLRITIFGFVIPLDYW